MSTAIAMLQEQSNFETLLKVAKWYNPEMPDQALEARVMQEIGYFEYACLLNDNLSTCDPRSVMMMVRWVIQNNLSIDSQAGLVYLKTRNVKQANGSLVKVLEYEPSPEGVLSMAYSTGEIIDHKRPVIHYDGLEKPKVIGVDFSFQLSTGRWETVSYAEGHFRKWRLASHENNARGSSDGDMAKMNKANKSYTSFNGGIDPEFCTGKAIKHGLDKRGTNRIAPKRAVMQQPAIEQSERTYYKLNEPIQYAPTPSAQSLGEPYVAHIPAADPSYEEMVKIHVDYVNRIITKKAMDEVMEDGIAQEMHANSPEFRAAVDAAITRLSPVTTFSDNKMEVSGEWVAGRPKTQFENDLVEAAYAAPVAENKDAIHNEMIANAMLSQFESEAAQSAIPLDFTPDPIHAFLAGCSSSADLTSLFNANKEKVLASDTLRAAFKKREQEINEARIAAEKAGASAQHRTGGAAASTPKITANDL